MSDSEIICQALEEYACRTVKNLLGFSSIPTQTLVRYTVRNTFQKYSKAASFLEDENGKIRADLLFDAFKTEFRASGGYTMFGVRFTEADIEEISKIYANLQEHNV